MIESRVVCSAANERHTAQHLPRLRIVNFRSAQRCWPAGRSQKQGGANGRPKHHTAQHSKILTRSGAADTGACKRANNCTGNRTGALTTVGAEWPAAGCSGSGVGAIPELEFEQTANLGAEAGHDRLVHDAGVDAELIPKLEFDQTLWW